ncbi:MAG: DciA family protein [Alistipes finegoldii]
MSRPKSPKESLPDTWRAVVGDRAADFTTELKLENHILYARIQSSVLRSELFYQREALKEEPEPAFRRPDRQCGDYQVDFRYGRNGRYGRYERFGKYRSNGK